LIEDEENRQEILEECEIICRASHPASSSQVKTIVFQILNHYEGFDRRSPESKAAIIADWLESLSEFPHDVLTGAARAWRECEKSSFTPTVGQIVALCSHAAYRLKLAERAREVRGTILNNMERANAN